MRASARTRCDVAAGTDRHIADVLEPIEHVGGGVLGADGRVAVEQFDADAVAPNVGWDRIVCRDGCLVSFPPDVGPTRSGCGTMMPGAVIFEPCVVGQDQLVDRRICFATQPACRP